MIFTPYKFKTQFFLSWKTFKKLLKKIETIFLDRFDYKIIFFYILNWEDEDAGLLLRAKFNSGPTRKTPFPRCFGLTTLQIRGVTFSIAIFVSKK